MFHEIILSAVRGGKNHHLTIKNQTGETDSFILNSADLMEFFKYGVKQFGPKQKGNTETINIGPYTVTIKLHADHTDNTNPSRK